MLLIIGYMEYISSIFSLFPKYAKHIGMFTTALSEKHSQLYLHTVGNLLLLTTLATSMKQPEQYNDFFKVLQLYLWNPEERKQLIAGLHLLIKTEQWCAWLGGLAVMCAVSEQDFSITTHVLSSRQADSVNR